MNRVSTKLSVILLAAISVWGYGCFDNSPTGDDGGNGEYGHRESPGASANDLLADTTYSRLVVEIDYMPGYAPNADALDSLKAFLQRRLNKDEILFFEAEEISSGEQNSYSADDVRQLESQYRDHYTEGEKLAAYMLITDGYYAQENVLGIAYYNTSSAFFGPAYADASSGFGAPSRYQVESTSFRHEFGHLFGLVNIEESGTRMQTDHQDRENGHHCDNESCLMYYAMESPSLIKQLFGDEVPALDANCRADLQANGGK